MATKNEDLHPPKPGVLIIDAPEKGHGGSSQSTSYPLHGTLTGPPTATVFDAKLCAKLDLRILTPMFFLSFLSLMGRTNIGAALIQGLPADLQLDATKVYLAICIPLIMIIVFDIPSNMVMRWLERRFGLPYMRYLSLTTIGLGIVTVGQGFDYSYGALLTTRSLVGLFETCLIPGCVYVLSLYYPGVHLQWRMSMLMTASIISNIIANILAYGIAKIRSANGYHGWRWIFVIEGLLTIAVGAACAWSDISRPEKATFLSEEEKNVIDDAVEARTTTIGLAGEWKVFLSSPLNYIWASLFLLTCSSTYSVSIFAPTLVQTFHPDWDVPAVQGQVIPVFIVSAAASLLFGWAADRLDHRCAFALIGYIFTIIGFAILRHPNNMGPSVQLLALYFISLGTYTSMPILWNLTVQNLMTPFQKSLGAGFVVGIGNAGGFVSAWNFRTSEAPYYTAGMTNGLIITSVAAGLTVVAWVFIIISNRSSLHGAGNGKEGAVAKYKA